MSKVTIQDVRKVLLGKSAAVRLQFHDYPYFKTEVVKEVLDDLSSKAVGVQAGIDDFSPSDRLMWRLLIESAGFEAKDFR